MRNRNFLGETNIAGSFPPLGLAYLAAYLKKWSHHEIMAIDLHVERHSPKRFISFLRGFKPDVIGMSSTSLIWPNVCDLAKFIKRALPESLLVVGGPQLGLYPIESLSFDYIDVGVIGEGEETFLELLEYFDKGLSLEGVRGIVFKKGGRGYINPSRPAIRDLDSLPFAAMELFPLKNYYAFGVRRPFLTMSSSRGCPYFCNFCLQGELGPFRQKGAEAVVEEMAYYSNRFRVEELVFFDETFTYDKERTIKICELIIEKKLHLRWSIRTRIDRIDREMLISLKAAGCCLLHLGIETVNQMTLNRMGKGLDLLIAQKNIRLAKAVGLLTRGYFMLGYPAEDRGDIGYTIRSSTRLGLDWATYSITVAHPGTRLYEDFRERYGTGDIWRKWTLRQKINRAPYFEGRGYGLRWLRWIWGVAHLRFYIHQFRLWRILLSLGPFELIKFIWFRLRRCFACASDYKNIPHRPIKDNLLYSVDYGLLKGEFDYQ